MINIVFYTNYIYFLFARAVQVIFTIRHIVTHMYHIADTYITIYYILLTYKYRVKSISDTNFLMYNTRIH